MRQDEHVYAVVLAGGSGTRLWPESRRAHPKQFCRLGSDKTMLEQTLLRLDGFVPAAQRLVVTQQAHYARTTQVVQGKDALAEEIIAEPSARGTLAAVSLATLALAARDPQAVIISLHADAFIRDVSAFQQALAAAVQAARHNYIALLGAQPHYAATCYDYIERSVPCEEGVHRARFHYRPTAQEAAAYVQKGDYFWNSGIFVWQAELFLQELHAMQPQVAKLLTACVKARGDIDRTALSSNYPQVAELSVDGFMAQSSRCVMLPLDCGWLDIGSWDALSQVFATDKDGNLVHGKVLMRDCRGTTARTSGVQVMTLGLQDVIVVVTDDAVLVCAKERAQEVRELVASLPEDLV